MPSRTVSKLLGSFFKFPLSTVNNSLQRTGSWWTPKGLHFPLQNLGVKIPQRSLSYGEKSISISTWLTSVTDYRWTVAFSNSAV